MQMFERGDDASTFDAALKVAFENLPRQCQANSGRQRAAVTAHTTHERSLSARGTGVSQRFQKRKAELIKKHDGYAFSPRFF